MQMLRNLNQQQEPMRDDYRGYGTNPEALTSGQRQNLSDDSLSASPHPTPRNIADRISMQCNIANDQTFVRLDKQDYIGLYTHFLFKTPLDMFCGARFVAKDAGCCCHVNAVPCKDLYPGVADKRRIGAIYGGEQVTISHRAYFLIKYKANAIKLVVVSKKRFLCEEEFFGEGLFAGMLGKSIASTEGAPTKQTAEWQRQRLFLS